MKRAIYYNIFGLGHIHPTLPLVQGLAHSGVEVLYHTSPERRALVEKNGARFQNYGYDSYKAADFNPGKIFVLQTIPAALGLLPYLIGEFEKNRPDFILYDSMAVWGKCIADLFNVPSFCTVTTFALNRDLKRQTFAEHGVVIDDITLHAQQELKKQYGITLDLYETLGAYGKNNLVFTSKDFNPDLGELSPSNFHFVGAMTERTEDPLPLPKKRKKRIVMSLGTILPEEDPSVLDWFRSLMTAFSDEEDVDLILSVGTQKNIQALGVSPANCFLFEKIPQLKCLQEADVFINHGGMNSINEGLHFRVPMIIVPHSNDQFVNARRLEELQLGLVLNKHEITPQKFKDSVDRVLTQKIQKHFHRALGLKGVMDLITKEMSL